MKNENKRNEQPINDGGPAYPIPLNPHEYWDLDAYGSPNGMSLRDHFAGQALAGDFASQNEATGTLSSDLDDEWLQKRAAFLYRFADAMIAACEKGDDRG